MDIISGAFFKRRECHERVIGIHARETVVRDKLFRVVEDFVGKNAAHPLPGQCKEIGSLSVQRRGVGALRGEIFHPIEGAFATGTS